MNSPAMFSVDVWQSVRSSKNRTEARSKQPCKTAGVPHHKFISLKSTAIVETSYVCVTKYDVRPSRCPPHKMPLAFDIPLPSPGEVKAKNPKALENPSKNLLIETSMSMTMSSIVPEDTQLPTQLATSDPPASTGELAPVALVDGHEESIYNLPSNDSTSESNPSNTTLVEAFPATPDKLASSSPVHSNHFLAFLEASHLEESRRFHEEQAKLSTIDVGCAQFNSAYYRRRLPPSLHQFNPAKKSSKPFCWKTRLDEIMKDEECIDMSDEVTEDTTTDHNRTLSASSLSSSSHLRLSSMSSDNTCVETPELLAGSFLDEQKENLQEQYPVSTSTATSPAESLGNIYAEPALISTSSPSLAMISSPLKSQKSSNLEVLQGPREENSKQNLSQVQEGERESAEIIEVQTAATCNKDISAFASSLSSPRLRCLSSSLDRTCVDTPNSIFLQRSYFTIVSRTSLVVFCSIILHFSLKMFL